jgi:hypothetical protein
MSGGAITEMGSADRAGWMRAIEAAVRRILGAGVAIAVKFTGGVTIAPTGTATTALTVTGPASPTVELAVWDASSLTNGQAVHLDKAAHQRFSQAAVPTAVLGTGAGTGAGTAPTVTLLAGSTDQVGTIQITTGTQVPVGGNASLVVVTFRNAYASTPKAVMVVPANVATLALARAQDVAAWRAGLATTGFQLITGATALAASTAYEWFYWVVG